MRGGGGGGGWKGGGGVSSRTVLTIPAFIRKLHSSRGATLKPPNLPRLGDITAGQHDLEGGSEARVKHRIHEDVHSRVEEPQEESGEVESGIDLREERSDLQNQVWRPAGHQDPEHDHEQLPSLQCSLLAGRRRRKESLGAGWGLGSVLLIRVFG